MLDKLQFDVSDTAQGPKTNVYGCCFRGFKESLTGGNNLGGCCPPRPLRGLTQPWSGNLDFPINLDLSNQIQKHDWHSSIYDWHSSIYECHSSISDSHSSIYDQLLSSRIFTVPAAGAFLFFRILFFFSPGDSKKEPFSKIETLEDLDLLTRTSE